MIVIPAKAGIQWVPAFAGTTERQVTARRVT